MPIDWREFPQFRVYYSNRHMTSATHKFIYRVNGEDIGARTIKECKDYMDNWFKEKSKSDRVDKVEIIKDGER